MTLEQPSPAKVNFLLNILGRRPDGFHEVETLLHPVPLYDQLELTRTGSDIELTSSNSSLPVDATNLVHRAATAFFTAAHITDGVKIHLVKNIPLAAGLGGGSSNAANTLLGLNLLFDQPLKEDRLVELAASLGSDVPFFLQSKPALAVGRGERIIPLEFFPALTSAWIILIHPGFGVSTPWAYNQLTGFPEALHGRPGRAQKLADDLSCDDLAIGAHGFYNALEAPVLRKYPLLSLFQEFLRAHGAIATLMSGSGSSTFALAAERAVAERLLAQFKEQFGPTHWTACLRLGIGERSRANSDRPR